MALASLSFAHGTQSTPQTWRRKSVSHVVTEMLVDGIPLRLMLAAAGRRFVDGVVRPPVAVSEVPYPDSRFTPPLGSDLPRDMRLAFLGSLLGSPWSDFEGLAEGRIPLALCPIDYDLECGFSTALLVIRDDIVRWEDIGDEIDDETVDQPSPEAGRTAPAPRRWIPLLCSPPAALQFDRLHYERAARDEIEFQSSLG